METLKKTFENVLNPHAPKKIQFLLGNQEPHTDKIFGKLL